MKIVKCRLSKIVKSPEAALLLKQTAERAHELKTTLYLLCKLCLIQRFKNHQALPADKASMERLFKDAFMILPNGKRIVGPQQEELRGLCTSAFPMDNGEPYVLNTKGLCGNWREYEAERYAYLIMNHIKANYASCLKNYISAFMTLDYKNDQDRAQINKLADELATGGGLAEHRKNLVPGHALTKNNAYFDVKVDASTMAYLPCMFYMCEYLEGLKRRIKGVLPLIRANIPSATMIFTYDLERLLSKEFLVDSHGQAMTKVSLREEAKTPKKRDVNNNLKCKGKDPEKDFSDPEWAAKEDKRIEGQIKMWGLLLDFSKRPLKSGPEWRFDTKIQTDGVSCSLYMEKRSVQVLKKCVKGAAFKEHVKENYVEDLSDDQRLELRGKRVISIDPGKNNIIMCYKHGTADYDEEHRKLMDKGTTYRYTQKQRDYDTHVHIIRKKAEERKLKQKPLAGKTLAEWEKHQSDFNSKTVDPVLFRQYIEQVMAYKAHVRLFYAKSVFRKERFNAYRLRQKSNDNVVRKLMLKMDITNADDVVIAFGDGARSNIRGRAPGPSAAIRKLFQRNHFRVIDVNEPYTSMRCFHCKDKAANNEPCRKEKDKNGELRDVWGLRRCNICHRPWSRDYHACLNIAHIALEHLDGKPRPSYLGAGCIVRKSKRTSTYPPGAGEGVNLLGS